MGSQSVMMDSYIVGIGHVSFVSPTTKSSDTDSIKTTKPANMAEPKLKTLTEERVLSPSTLEPVFNQTDEDKLMTRTVTDEIKLSRKPGDGKQSNINVTEEYNTRYTGFSILPWENFVINPRVFNELFYAEKNQKITYDPDEVNVFFHGKNVLPPTVGDISENGKAWNIIVNTVGELREVRACLTERVSVFGVTLLYRENKFSKTERAPCLVMLDPLKSNLGEQLYSVLTRAIDSMHAERKFCLEINLNGCVERWCRRVLLTDCKAVGAKLIIINGEEFEAGSRTKTIACCIACFPLWLMQTAIYKLHRMVVYDDFSVSFDCEDLFLHGAFQDPVGQRHKIFTCDEDEVFRIQSVEQTDEKTLENLGIHKFLCVKRYDRNACMLSEDGEFTMQEHRTIAFNRIVDKRKEKVLSKEQKAVAKTKTKHKNKSHVAVNIETNRKVRFDTYQTERKHSLDNKDKAEAEIHDNAAYQDSDNDADSFKALPVLASSYDMTENDATDIVGITSSTGTFFSSQSKHVSPRLKTENEPENIDINSTNVKAFYESDISDDDDLSEEEKEDNINTGDQNENLTSEMKRISQSIPKTEASNKMSKATDIEEIKNADKQSSIDKKKFTKGKSKDKTNMKRVLKDLMKTTKADSNGNQTSTDNDTENKEIKNPNGSTNKNEMTNDNIDEHKPNANASHSINSKSVAGQQHKNSKENVNKESVQSESQLDSTDKPSKISNKTRPGKKEVTNIESFRLEDSSSDGSEVEMIYQSDMVKLEQTEMNQLNTEANSENENSQVTPLKPILKVEKGHMSPKVQRKPIKDTLVPNKPIRKSKEFKMPDDLALVDNEDEIWSSLRSSKIIPVTVTDSIKSENTVACSTNGPMEMDMEISDWGTVNESSKAKETVNESSKAKVISNESTASQMKSMGERLAERKKKRGVNRLDSSRKYLSASVPHKTKK